MAWRNNIYRISPGFSCILIAGLLVVSGLLGWHSVRAYLMVSHGVTVVGTATSAHTIKVNRGRGYAIDYVFEYNGVTYHGESGASYDWVKQTRLPSPLNVQFYPGDPTMSWPPDFGGYPVMDGIVLTLGLLALAAFLAIKAVIDSRTPLKVETDE